MATATTEQVQAWKASDGSLFATEYEARKHSVKHELTKLLDQKKDRSLVDFLCGNSSTVISILSQLKG